MNLFTKLQILSAGVVMFCVYGYTSNIVKLTPITSAKETLIRGTGVIAPPVGVMLGYVPKTFNREGVV